MTNSAIFATNRKAHSIRTLNHQRIALIDREAHFLQADLTDLCADMQSIKDRYRSIGVLLKVSDEEISRLFAETFILMVETTPPLIEPW